eukprot:Gb_29938 [translate_table: standard]
MVRNDLYITIPTFFKCPISLDIMKSPVSLSTGVTYDRSSIQKWLDDGNNTCPATMQVLESKDVIPNYTLRRLIQVWSASNQISKDSDTATSSFNLNPVEPQQVKDILQDITNGVMESERLRKLSRFAIECEKNRESLVKAGAVPILAGILSIHDLEKESSPTCKKVVEICEQAVKILGLIPQNESTRRILVSAQPLSSIVWLLQKGSQDGKIESAKLVESLAIDGEMKILIAAKEGLLEGLLKLSTMEVDATAIDAGLRCLLSLCIPKRNRIKLIRLGAVGHLSKLVHTADAGNAERVLALLELLSACADGRSAISEDPQCIPAIVKKMLKVSDSATEHAVIILWAICYLSSDQRAQNAVLQSNGLTKILLLMQSNCSPAVRQMAGNLLKIFREMSKDYPYSYDSKMTHIMPF